MESTQNIELVGGVARVAIYPAAAPLPEDVGGGGELVAIEPRGSFYRERTEIREGQRVVLHHLELLTPCDFLPFDDEEIEGGFIVDLELESGKRLRLGWSEKFGERVPLKLLSVEALSGERRLDYPQKRWVFESMDLTSLL